MPIPPAWHGARRIKQLTAANEAPVPHLAFAHFILAECLARLGRRDSALVELAVADSIISGHPYEAYVSYTRARIDMLLDRQQEALDILERIVAPPNVSPADRFYSVIYTRPYLRLDPNFARLHGNPRFERLTKPIPSSLSKS